jgi:hypothetical protein
LHNCAWSNTWLSKNCVRLHLHSAALKLLESFWLSCWWQVSESELAFARSCDSICSTYNLIQATCIGLARTVYIHRM